MIDIDYVFARFNRDASGSNERCEQLTVRGRAGAAGTRTVQVVHIRSSGCAVTKSEPRLDRQVRAASWEHGFPAKPAARATAVIEVPAAERLSGVTPAWAPTPIQLEAPSERVEPVAVAPELPTPPKRQTRSTSDV